MDDRGRDQILSEELLSQLHAIREYVAEIPALKEILDLHGRRLDGIEARLTSIEIVVAEHSATLAGQSATLAEQSAILAEHSAILAAHSAILTEQSGDLREIKGILGEQMERTTALELSARSH